MMTDALSKVANQSSAPKCVFSTDFKGITLGSPSRVTDSFWTKSISGLDTSGIEDFFGSGIAASLWHITTDATVPDLAAFNSTFVSAINTSTTLTGKGGAGELSLNHLIASAAAPPQTPLMLVRGISDAIANDRREYYFAATYMFPVGMALNAAGKYKTIFEIKSGGLKRQLVEAVENGTTRDGSSCAAVDGVAGLGTFRFYLEINGSGGINNEIRVKLDDNARNGSFTGGSFSQPPSAWWDETGYHSVDYVSGASVFHVHKRTGVSVPLGVPVRFHVHLKKPPTPLYEDRPQGILKVMMENLDTGDIEMLCDIQDSYEAQLCSSFNEPDTRLYWTSYDAIANLELKMTDLQIWDKPPIRISADPEPEILSRHILVDPIPGVGHEIYGVLASSQAQDIFRQAWETGGDMQPASAQAARTDTGYPVIESVTETTFASDSVNHAVAMPATVNAGDGLLVFLTIDGDSIPTTPAEWDKLYSEAYSTSVTGCAYALVATGTEGGTTVDFVTGSAEKGAAQVYRISNWNGTLGGFHNGIVAENGSGSTADLPAITAYWESAKTLWIGALHTSTSQTVSSAPTNYTDLTQTSSGAATTDGQCITARRFNETATEDPGVFTMSGTGAAKVYNTVAIAPAYVGPNYERFEVEREGTTLWQGLYTTQDHTVADPDITRAVIVVHGRSLDAAEYHNVVAHNMRDYLGNTIVLAPFYERNVERADVDQLFWGSSWPQLGRSSSLLPWRISSGEIMDLLIAHLYNTFENLEGVVIAGHSAGGQFCNRYSMASTDSRNRFIVSAPSSYAYPGVHRPDGNGGFRVPSSPSTYNDWKYGLDNLSSVSYANAIGASNLRRRFIYAKVHYMVGALDTDPASSSLDVTDDAMVQGTQRVERQSYFYDYVRLVSVWR